MDLTTYFLPAFLSTVLTIATGCSMAIVFDRLGRWIFKTDEVLARAMYFFAGLLVLAWLLMLAGIAGLVRAEWVSRIPYLFIGAAALIVIADRSFQPIHLFAQPFRMTVDSNWDRVTRIAVYIATGAFFFICLAPPTDADSLDYHLGVPVEMLRTGGLLFDKGNLHFRMFGFGEMLNLPAVASGCPQLGAFIQFLAFRYLLRVYSEPVSGKTRLNLLVTCMGIPLLIFLVAGQKHQLTGIVATSLAFYALQQRDGRLQYPYTFLFWAVLVFAIGIKYSFVISASMIVLLLILKYGRWPHVSQNLFGGVLTFIVFLAPLYIFKAIRFRDPLSPLLERFKSNADPVAVYLQHFLGTYRDSPFPLPLNLFVPPSPGLLTTVIGLGAIIIFLFLFSRGFWAEKIALLLFVAFTVGIGQNTARFFLEPLFWVAPLFFASLNASKWHKLLFTGLRLQLILLLPVLLFTVYSFGPGLFTDKGRDQVMRSFATGYSEARWMDSTLPPNVKIAGGTRSRSLMPREYVPVEYIAYYAQKGGNFAPFDSVMRVAGVDYYVITDYDFNGFGASFNKLLLGCKNFERATRNPLNKYTYNLCVYKAKP